jgi:hypothetical protein
MADRDRDRRWIPVIGIACGMGLGFAAAFGGWAAFVIVLLLGVLGYLVGRVLIGDTDLAQLFSTRRRS